MGKAEFRWVTHLKCYRFLVPGQVETQTEPQPLFLPNWAVGQAAGAMGTTPSHVDHPFLKSAKIGKSEEGGGPHDTLWRPLNLGGFPTNAADFWFLGK